MSLPLKPAKRLGQNFLRHVPTLERMCAAAKLDGSDDVIEIGPGYGTLTRALLKNCKTLLSLEKDTRLVEIFPEDIKADERFTLVPGDVMKTGLERFYSGRPLKLVSNLPYGISSGVLRLLAESRGIFSVAVVMLQKEVALRLAASPGGKSYGALTANFQMTFDVEKLFDVSPELFTPRPAVTSSVVRLTPLEKTRFALKSERFYAKTVRAAFSGRRKMIRNSLLSVFPRSEVEDALKAAGVEGERRAETVGLEEFSLVSDRLFETAGRRDENL